MVVAFISASNAKAIEILYGQLSYDGNGLKPL